MQTYPKKLKGVIVSNRMKDTAVVLVNRLAQAPKYHKYYKVSKKFKAHNAGNQYQEGETVIIQETRPISKDKKWIIVAKV